MVCRSPVVVSWLFGCLTPQEIPPMNTSPLRRTALLLLLLLPLRALAGTATITIDVHHVVSPVDPHIYGIFMEPIGIHRDGMNFNTLYGPVYDPKSPLADAHGFRKDIIAAARELQLTQMRWPGGNFTSTYDWRDGIGPQDRRPKRLDLAWGVVEPNQVGTDEWIQLNREIGSDNVVCINAGDGTLKDAYSWVQYCNAPVGSYWADKRAEYGHPQPYGIKYWCLGNEVDGAPWIIGHKTARDYVKFAVEAAKAMQRSSPGTKLKFIASGSSNYQDNLDWVKWNWTVIQGLYGIADYISLHRYWDDSKDYYVFLGQRAVDLDEKISITAGQLKALEATRHGTPMYISVDEWAPPFRGGYLSTLALAEYFNAFLRHADVVKMANYTLLTSILGRDPKTDQTYKTPLFYAFKLFSTHCRGVALDPLVDCGTFATSAYYRNIPYLDVSSVYDEKKGRVVINVVNRDKDDAVTTEIHSIAAPFAGPATLHQIVSDDLTNQPFTYAARATYPPKTATIATSGSTLRCTFPAHSFTQIVVPVHAGPATAAAGTAPGGETPADVSAARARANFARKIVLAPDDVRAFPDAPAGYRTPRPGIPHGRVVPFTYHSGVTGTDRQANVYLPPGYTPAKRYPVLYLLHGIGGDDTEWLRDDSPNVVLDNLIAEGRAVPMIVVLPNGRALPDDRVPKAVFSPENAAGFAKFEGDLLDYLIPAVQAKYPTLADREHRAIAGLSMGGGQALDFGLAHLDTFAWIGAFSPAPNTKPPAELVPDPAAARAQLKLLYLSCGNHDGLIAIAQGVHRYLKAHDVPHLWNVDDAGHDPKTWGNNFYHFAQRIFR